MSRKSNNGKQNHSKLIAFYLVLLMLALIAIGVNSLSIYVILSITLFWLNARSLFLNIYRGFIAEEVKGKSKLKYKLVAVSSFLLLVSMAFSGIGSLQLFTLFLFLSFVLSKFTKIGYNCYQNGVGGLKSDLICSNPKKYIPGTEESNASFVKNMQKS